MAEETKKEGTTKERRTDENVIYVGQKPPDELRACSSKTV